MANNEPQAGADQEQPAQQRGQQEQMQQDLSVAPVNKRRQEPATFYGEDMASGEPPYGKPYPQGFFEASGRAFSLGVEDVAHRWRSLSGDEESVTQEEFDEIVGDAPVSTKWGPSMTRERAQFLADEARREQYTQQFEGRPVAQFLGASLPTVADPISVATMPIGGTSFQAAARATSLGQFLKHSTAGGAKVGAATAPIELAAQPEFYGEVRPEMLAGAAAGPVVASPLLSLPGYALKSIGGRMAEQNVDTAIDMAEAAAKQGEMNADVAGATARMEDGDGDLPPPPMESRPPDTRPAEPRAELDRMFGDWTGKERGWLRDLAAGDEAAAQRARDIGVDPDAPAMQRFLRKEGRHTDARSRFRDEDRFTEVRDYTDFVKGRASQAQKQRLAANGLVESAETATLARQTPEDWQLGEILRKAQEADAAEAELRELGSKPHMAPVQEALETPAARRSRSQQEMVRAFEENGAGAARNAHIERLRRDYEDLLDQESRIEEEIEGGLRQFRELEDVRVRRQRTYEELDRVENEGRTVQDGQFDMDEFLTALGASRMESASPGRPAQRRTQIGEDNQVADAATAAKRSNDEEINRMKEYARKNGVDTDAVDAEAQKFMNRVLEC